MSRNIKVPIICNEDWDKMSPKENGRFCDTCKLTVVDFTKMSDNEIKNYLLSKSYVCGRFDCTQVETSHEKTLDLLKRKTKKINFKPLRWLAILFLLILALLLFIPAFIFSYKGDDDDTDRSGIMGMPVENPNEK